MKPARKRSQGALTAAAAAAIVAMGMVAWLAFGAGPSGREPPRRVADAPVPERGRGAASPERPDGEAAAPEAAGAAERGASGPTAPAGSDAVAELRRALLLADKEATTDQEVLEAKRLLEHVLRNRPELAGPLAEMLGELTNKKLAFVVTRVLGRFVREPAVRNALLGHIADGGPLAKEMAIYTFVGLRDDPEVATAVAGAFEDRGASEPVRQAAAFGLVEMMESLPAPAQEAVRAEARVTVMQPDLTPQTRAEALDLLDVAHNAADRGTARHLLEAGPPEVVLAAARVLLTNQEPEAHVLAALERLADTSLDGMAQRSLKAMLEEIRQGGGGGGGGR